MSQDLPTTLIGDPAFFAIEYARPVEALHGFLHARLWVGGRWFGELESVVVGESFAIALLRYHSRHRYEPTFIYRTLAESPPFCELMQQGYRFTLGEAFDGFGVTWLRILDPPSIAFTWQLHEARYHLFPKYPRDIQRSDVNQDVFDSVVERLASEICDLLSPLTVRFELPVY